MFSSGMEDEKSNKKTEPNRIHRPHPDRYIRKIDCSHSLVGGMFGLIILIIAIITLSLFYGMKDEHTEESRETEVLENISSESKHSGRSTHSDGINTGNKVRR